MKMLNRKVGGPLVGVCYPHPIRAHSNHTSLKSTNTLTLSTDMITREISTCGQLHPFPLHPVITSQSGQPSRRYHFILVIFRGANAA